MRSTAFASNQTVSDTGPNVPARPRFACSIVACARWETDRITEWLDYHRLIGFEHVFLYCNDDDPAELYEKILPFGADFVTFTWFPLVGEQVSMYLHFLEHHRHSTEWFQFLDVDEYLYLGRHERISDYVATIPDDWDSVYLNWLGFGPNGHVERAPGSVLLAYTARARRPDVHTKTLTRSSRVSACDVDPFARHIIHHHWQHAGYGVTATFNILGAPMDAYWDAFPDRAEAYLNDPAVAAAIADGPCVFHYVVQSDGDLERRAARSTSGEFKPQADWARLRREGKLDHIFAQFGEVRDERLAAIWARHLQGWRRTAVLAPPRWPNVSRGKPAEQSSISVHSQGATTGADAARALDGRPSGQYAFHTETEERPWWRIDLGGPHRMRELRVYNRFDASFAEARFRNFDVEMSDDATSWTTLAQERGEARVGGIDGRPYTLSPPDGAVCRHVRITLVGEGPQILHLDHVEVFGEPLE